MIIKKNKVYTEGHENEATGINVSGERLILEASGTLYDEYDVKEMVDYHGKRIYRKISSFKELLILEDKLIKTRYAKNCFTAFADDPSRRLFY